MKRICSLAVCLLMIMCLMVPAAFAGVNAKNTLDGQVTLTDVNSFETYTIGYTVTSNSNSDWNLTLEEEVCDNAAFSQVYTGTIKAGSSLAADTKNFISSVTDAGGDLIKNTGGDAIDESFSKTFDELRPKKK